MYANGGIPSGESVGAMMHFARTNDRQSIRALAMLCECRSEGVRKHAVQVCMYVCMCICVHVLAMLWVCVNMLCMYVCMYPYICVCSFECK
jgi:hypothetical protein